MSQNSIITAVLVILAATVGVYFFFIGSTPQTGTTSYDTPKEVPVSTDNGLPSTPSPVVENTVGSQSPALPTSTSNNQGGSSNEPVVPTPVVIKNKYTVSIKGTVESLSKEFVIKAFDNKSVSEEFSQTKLTDGVYKFESEKAFNSISINVAGYAPVLKENLVLSENKLTVEVEMDAYAGFSGDVKSFLEKPISGAKITIEKGAFKKVLNADVQGEFKLAELAAGQYSFSIQHPQFDSKTMVLELAKGEDTKINVKLERDALIEGIVSTSDGKPTNKMEGLLKHETDESKNKPFTTDEKGHFQITRITEGKYTLEFSTMLGSLTEPLVFARNMEVMRDFKLLPPPSIAGVVVDESGKPVAGVKIFTYDDNRIVEDETKAEGKFNLILMKKGNYRVLTSSEIYEVLNSTKLYSPSLEKIVIQVKKKAFLKGKILTASGVIVRKDFTLKLINKTKKTEIPLHTTVVKDGKILIAMSSFKFFSADDEIQIGVDSTVYGKGVSLAIKVSALSEENEFLITLGE